MNPVTVLDSTHGLCSGDFEELAHVCIMPEIIDKTYDLKFFEHCDADDMIREDLEDQFYSNDRPVYSFDIKPFAHTPIEQYVKVIDRLKTHLNLHPCLIHLTNFGLDVNDVRPEYDDIASVKHIIKLITDIVISSPFHHVIELALKEYDYDNKYDDKYYHSGYVMELFDSLVVHKNIKQVIITESSMSENAVSSRERIVKEYKPDFY